MNSTVSAIDGKASRSGSSHRLSRNGTPSFIPTANSEIRSATSADALEAGRVVQRVGRHDVPDRRAERVTDCEIQHARAHRQPLDERPEQGHQDENGADDERQDGEGHRWIRGAEANATAAHWGREDRSIAEDGSARSVRRRTESVDGAPTPHSPLAVAERLALVRRRTDRVRGNGYACLTETIVGTTRATFMNLSARLFAAIALLAVGWA